MSIFSFMVIYMSEYQWIFTKLGMCIDILEIWSGIANGQILSIFDSVVSPPHESIGVLSFHVFYVLLSKKLPGSSCSKRR